MCEMERGKVFSLVLVGDCDVGKSSLFFVVFYCFCFVVFLFLFLFFVVQLY